MTASSAPRRVRVLWNPTAGAKAGPAANRPSEAWLLELMARNGLGQELHATASEDDARRLAREAVAAGYDVVVAAGGDGTIGVVALELLDSPTALGILPLGTVMNVPRSLGLSRELEPAAAALGRGRTRAIDVGEANGRPFFEVASVGMNAAMFREAQRFADGEWGSILATLWVAFRYRPARIQVHHDGGVVRTRALMVSVANGPFTGVAMTVAPAARLDDGRFDVVLFRHFSKLRLLRHLVGIAFGRYRPAPETQTLRSAAVRIEAVHPLPARADSHDLGTTPLELRVRPGALRVIVPA